MSVPANLARVSATVVETGDTVDLVEANLRSKVGTVRLAMVNGGVNEKAYLNRSCR